MAGNFASPFVAWPSTTTAAAATASVAARLLTIVWCRRHARANFLKLRALNRCKNFRFVDGLARVSFALERFPRKVLSSSERKSCGKKVKKKD